jgi:hypothetical protein
MKLQIGGTTSPHRNSDDIYDVMRQLACMLLVEGYTLDMVIDALEDTKEILIIECKKTLEMVNDPEF